MKTLCIVQATRGDRAVLEAIQLRASVANPGDRDSVLANPDAVSVPVEQIDAGCVFAAVIDDEFVGFDAIDAVVRRPDGKFVTVQIKARSKDVIEGDAALFAAIPHEIRENYWWVFYSERMDTTWVMTSSEFVAASVQNKTGKNKGKRSIWFNGTRKDKVKGGREEYCKPQFEKFIAKDFRRLVE